VPPFDYSNNMFGFGMGEIDVRRQQLKAIILYYFGLWWNVMRLDPVFNFFLFFPLFFTSELEIFALVLFIKN
jgi:hypothetical protein